MNDRTLFSAACLWKDSVSSVASTRYISILGCLVDLKLNNCIFLYLYSLRLRTFRCLVSHLMVFGYLMSLVERFYVLTCGYILS